MEYPSNFYCLVFIRLAFWHQIEQYVPFVFVSLNTMTSDFGHNWELALTLNPPMAFTNHSRNFSDGLFDFLAMQK